jgi:hypothetical protein
MRQKRFTEEQSIGILKEAEDVLPREGKYGGSRSMRRAATPALEHQRPDARGARTPVRAIQWKIRDERAAGMWPRRSRPVDAVLVNRRILAREARSKDDRLIDQLPPVDARPEHREMELTNTVCFP